MQTNTLYQKYIYLKEINYDRYRKYDTSNQNFDGQNSNDERKNKTSRRKSRKARIQKRF